ncbi:MAG: porin, partial [Rugosibacter sp.]
MQKKLIALAIAGLSSAAFAQTNVTIYGVADASFDFI